MSVILILILASLSLALTFLAGFIWAVKSGQFEDTFTPSMRVLSEDDSRRARFQSGVSTGAPDSNGASSANQARKLETPGRARALLQQSKHT